MHRFVLSLHTFRKATEMTKRKEMMKMAKLKWRETEIGGEGTVTERLAKKDGKGRKEKERKRFQFYPSVSDL